MAMYIKNDDLEFLNKVYKDLKEVVDYVDDANKLFDLIKRLQEQRYRDRQKNGKSCSGEKSKKS